MKRIGTILLLLFGAALLVAQEIPVTTTKHTPVQTKQPQPAPATTPAPKPSAPAAEPPTPLRPVAPAPQALPEPTHEQALEIENLQLKAALLDQQKKGLEAQYNALIQQIVAEHPGYTWDPIHSQLRPLPPPHKETPPAK